MHSFSEGSEDGLAAAQLADEGVARSLAETLSTWQTVDRRHVHKSALAEVFVTDVMQVGQKLYAVAAQWPRSHHFFRPVVDGAVHPLLFVEALRQAGLCLVHRYLGVPLDHQFVFRAISAQYAPSPPLTVPRPGRSAPNTVVLLLAVESEKPGPRHVGATLRVEAWCGSERIATATATYRCLSAAAYRRVRAQDPTGPTPPMDVLDVVTTPLGTDRTAHRTLHDVLDVDGQNPTFFDHPVDHLPGMLLLQGALSAAGVGSADQWPRLRGFDITFHRYAELDPPTHVRTRCLSCSGGDRVGVWFDQSDRTVARGWVSMRPRAHAEERA